MSHFNLSFITGGVISPKASIYVKSSGKDGDPPRYIGRDCNFPDEWDDTVNSLIDELSKIREEGHRKFDAEHRKSSTQI